MFRLRRALFKMEWHMFKLVRLSLFCNLYTRLSIKIASLYIYNFVSVHYIVSLFIYLFNFLFNSIIPDHFVRLLSRPIQSISADFAHFLDPQAIRTKTEVYKFIFGMLALNVKFILWSRITTVKSRSLKTAVCGTFVLRMHKGVRYCLDKNHDGNALCRN